MLNRRLLRIKVVKSLYSYLNSGETRLQSAQKELIDSNDKCYGLYLELLKLIVEVADYSEQKIEAARVKLVPTAQDLSPNKRFIHNSVVQMIRQTCASNSQASKGKLWKDYPEVVEQIYNEMLRSDYFQNYMNSPDSSFESDKRMVLEFYHQHIEDNPIVEKAVEESSILWADDLGYSLLLVIKTINEIKQSPTESNSQDLETRLIKLLPQYKNDQDRDFAIELLTKAILNQKEYLQYIDEFAVNWDLERIAFMDKVIMITALSELINFESIPTKVTIDEYIEISKYYSSPSSGIFINGIIDKASKTLSERGTIIKSGRGLI